MNDKALYELFGAREIMDLPAAVNRVLFSDKKERDEIYRLNEHDYANLKWEDEPVEVFVNMENFSEHEQHEREERLKMIENLMKNGENK